MKYRHEWKHEIGYADMLALRSRLKAIAKSDPNTADGKYFIRSLYFDNIFDDALREKIDGVNKREKFRIRFYNLDTSFIRLEKKSKISGLCAKESVFITKELAQAIADGDCDWMAKADNPLIEEFYSKIKSKGLFAKTVVDYDREPFTFSAGNVRVTLDYNIRASDDTKNFLSDNLVTVPLHDNPIILEVKWDEFLPDIIRDAVQLEACRTSAFSKYAACRTIF